MSKNATVKKVLSIVANVAVWVFVAFSVLVTVLVFTAQGSEDGIPSLFGKSLITVSSDSMSPEFKKGDLIVIEKLSVEEITKLGEDSEALAVRKGEVITYRAPIDINGDGQIGDVNTHRIVGTTVDNGWYRFKTQGDNEEMCPTPDGYELTHNDVIGIWTGTRIAGVGGIIDFLRSSLGFFLCIVLPLILFFLYELYNFISLILKERAKAAPAGVVDSATEEEIKRRAVEEYIRQQQLAAQGTAPVAEASAEESAVAPEAENLETTEETSKDGE